MRLYGLGGAAAAALVIGIVVASGMLRPNASVVEQRPTETTRFSHDGSDVEVIFRGELGHDELFAAGETLAGEGGIVVPIDGDGEPEGAITEARPAWLSFTYRIDGDERNLLVAKQPVMNDVSWDAIARAGAALGDGVNLPVGGANHLQDATLQGADGHRYRVRLLRCGQSTTAPLAEWNLLIGAVHTGDRDFAGDRYGWITAPYSDSDLVVGYGGSLNWCQEPWRENRRQRVVRGYFKVSRFHATASEFSGDRVYWRPALERIEDDDDARISAPLPDGLDLPARPQVSPDRRVRYFGPVSNEALWGDEGRIADLVSLDDGEVLGDGAPPWLLFQYAGGTLLLAARPVRRSLSWDAIARAGAALGDGSSVRVGRSSHRQDTEISDVHGNRYRVRLVGCGRATLDRSSEWNRLIGGLHRGDGDFVASPDGVYGWVANPAANAALGIVSGHGGATWCRETEQLRGDRHAINRGYMTVARYHLTESSFSGSGFGWRPVLELIPPGE